MNSDDDVRQKTGSTHGMSQPDTLDQLGRDELVARIEALEDRVERLEKKQSFTLEDIVDLEDRIEQLERGEVDLQALGYGNPTDLPIQRIRADVVSGRADVEKQMRRASEIWARFFDAADPSQGQYTLSSTKVRTMFAEEGIPNQPQQVKLAMQALVSASDGYIELKKQQNTLTLVAEKEPLDRLLRAQQETVDREDNNAG